MYLSAPTNKPEHETNCLKNGFRVITNTVSIDYCVIARSSFWQHLNIHNNLQSVSMTTWSMAMSCWRIQMVAYLQSTWYPPYIMIQYSVNCINAVYDSHRLLLATKPVFSQNYALEVIVRSIVTPGCFCLEYKVTVVNNLHSSVSIFYKKLIISASAPK